MTNIPDRLASVMFPEGPRVTSVADGKMANAATFTFLREDHTLGNMLRMCVCDGAAYFSPRPAGARFPPPVPAAAARTPAAPNLPTRTPRRARPCRAGSCCATLTSSLRATSTRTRWTWTLCSRCSRTLANAARPQRW
jgi:hypothetical protein